MSKLKKLKRVFVVNSTRIADPAPSEPLNKVTRILAQSYPQFRWSELYEEDGNIVGDSLEFVLKLPPPKVNG